MQKYLKSVYNLFRVYYDEQLKNIRIQYSNKIIIIRKTWAECSSL